MHVSAGRRETGKRGEKPCMYRWVRPPLHMPAPSPPRLQLRGQRSPLQGGGAEVADAPAPLQQPSCEHAATQHSHTHTDRRRVLMVNDIGAPLSCAPATPCSPNNFHVSTHHHERYMLWWGQASIAGALWRAAAQPAARYSLAAGVSGYWFPGISPPAATMVPSARCVWPAGARACVCT